MTFMGPGILQYLQMMGGVPAGTNVPSSGTGESASGSGYLAGWLPGSNPYYSPNPCSPEELGLPPTHFYLVLSFPAGDYADKMDVHPKYPMLVPASDTTPDILGVFSGEKAANKEMAADKDNVHLMYNLRLRGYDKVNSFLEFCAENDIIVPITGR